MLSARNSRSLQTDLLPPANTKIANIGRTRTSCTLPPVLDEEQAFRLTCSPCYGERSISIGRVLLEFLGFLRPPVEAGR